jgi:hypothetical protein
MPAPLRPRRGRGSDVAVSEERRLDREIAFAFRARLDRRGLAGDVDPQNVGVAAETAASEVLQLGGDHSDPPVVEVPS